jgi:hypothetical protein
MSPRSRELRSLAVRACFAIALLGGASTIGCGQQIEVGSDVLWTARFENGDLSEWMSVSGGGVSAFPAPNAVDVSSDHARGKYAARLSIQTASDGSQANAGLFRTGSLPVEAYYSAWYYLPQTYRTTEDWTIMQFTTPPGDDGGSDGLLIDVDLRSLPGGDMILDIFDHRPPYLRSPTAEPAQPVPIARWFQIEVFYRNVGDHTGEFKLFLDGQVNYDIQRPFGQNSTTYWSPCNSTVGLSPVASDLYVDDAAISLIQVGTAGTL